MAERMTYMDTVQEWTCRLVVEDGKPVELAFAAAQAERLTGNVYLGRVQKVLPGMHAAFVDIGLSRNAFLSLDDLPAAAREQVSAKDIKPSKPLKGGQEVIVQVVKEPGGDKGPRASMNPALPGRYVVLLPTLVSHGVSRHITDVERREALLDIAKRHCPPGMGLVMRTASEDAGEPEIAADIDALRAEWAQAEKTAQTAIPPMPLLGGSDFLAETRRDLGEPIQQGPIDAALLQKAIKALQRKVWMPSGAYLVIDHCEAMTVIDVNSGKNTGKKDLASSLRKLNLEAAREIARQLRLRDIGGIVIIDFVDMEAEEDRALVLETFEEAMRADRAKHHIHGFTGAGLLELTRRPVYQPLRAVLAEPCKACGVGIVQSAQGEKLLRDLAANRGEIDA